MGILTKPFKKIAGALAISTSLSACGGGFDVPDLRGNFYAEPIIEPFQSMPEMSGAQQPDYMAYDRAASTNPFQIEVRSVDYYGYEPLGTILINVEDKKLYYVTGGGTALEFPIATARPNVHEDYSNLVVGLLRENPSWTPTDSMVGAEPTGRDDPRNPLGEYAINLNRNGQDTLLRIHGTNAEGRMSIGTAASSGCIRMLNEHVAILFYHIQASNGRGAAVRVYEHGQRAPGLNYDGAPASGLRLAFN